MQGVFFQSGLRIIRQVLDWFQTAKDSSDKERRLDYASYGIIKAQLNEFDIIAGTNNAPPTPSIWVKTGVAYDVNGERIVIDDETISYDPTNPFDTTNDGLGNLVSTPHSTGSKNIPLTVNVNNYVWIDYLQTTDETVFTLHKVTRAKQFYKLVNGYQITVTLVNTPPTVNSLLLGNVDLTGFGVVSPTTISKLNRVYSLVKQNTVKIHTAKADRSDATPSYVADTDYVLDDHIKAVGTGVVSATNPHGLTPLDLGLNTQEILETHQKFMHTNGIIGDNTSTTSSAYLFLQTVTPGDDYVIIRKLTISELALVNGTTISNTDIPADVTLLFSSITDPVGTYWVYLDKFTKSVQRTNVNPTADATKLPLWSFTWTPGIFPLYDGNITSIVDLRIWGTLDSIKLYDGSVSIPSLSFSSDQDTGIYRSGSGIMSFTSNGVLSANISGGQITALDGSSSLPAYSFLNDTDTGLYNTTNKLHLTVGSVEQAWLDNTGQIMLSPTTTTTYLWFGSDNHVSIRRLGTEALRFYAFSNTEVFRMGDTFGTNYSLLPHFIQAYDYSGTDNFTIQNNFSGGSSQFVASVQTTGGDPFSTYEVVGGTSWSLGNDNNDSDNFKISKNATLGTNDYLVINTSGQTLLPQGGTASTPTLSFISDTNTGIYNNADVLTITTGGSDRLTLSSTGTTSTGNIYTPMGSNALPAYSFTGHTSTGMYMDFAGADSLYLAVAGVAILGVGNYSASYRPVTALNQGFFRGWNGTLTYPTFNMNGNTGMYSPSSNYLGLVSNGALGLQIDPNGQVTKPLNSAFLAYSATVANVTGAGVTYGVVFNNSHVIFDQNGDFGNTYFNAPVTGRYAFDLQIFFNGSSSHQNQFVNVNIVTPNRTYQHDDVWASSSTGIWVSFSVIADLDAGDQCYVTVNVGGGAQDVSILGGTNPMRTWWSGTLVD